MQMVTSSGFCSYLNCTRDTSLFLEEKETTSIASNGGDDKELRATVLPGRRHAVSAPPVVAPGVAWVSESAEVSGLDLGHQEGSFLHSAATLYILVAQFVGW